MRVIRLEDTDEGKRAFVHLYSGVRAKPVEGIDQIRLVGKILDKMETVGVTRGEGEKQYWELAPGGGELWLDDAQFKELSARMNAAKWPPDAARFVAKTFDLLAAAREEDPTKPRIVPDAAPAEAVG